MKKTSSASRAFSLIQFSLSLVIIGLIAGGIVLGRNMLHAAEWRSVITDGTSYIAATNSFREKYRALPSDSLRATTYWPTTANGNGDGVVTGAERFRFWEQLHLAGFVEKSFTGLQGANGADDFTLGTNVPVGRVANTGFGFYFANIHASPATYAVNLGNAFTYGKTGKANSGPPSSVALTPTDAQAIDRKTDDGHPSTGNWVANLTGGAHFGNPSACTTDASGTSYSGSYNTTTNVVACSFYIKSGY